MSLNARAWVGIGFLAFVMGVLLFGGAGTFDFWQAWVYLAIFFTASISTTVYLIKHDPELLTRRLKGGPMAEKRTSQKIIMLFVSIGFVALLVIPAFNRRFAWSGVPVWLVIAGDILTAAGFYIIFLVYRENSFAAATIGVAEEQKVISTGPYAVVRHPMYAGASLYMLGMPPALASYGGFLVLACIAPFFIWRILDEERFLKKNLAGYTEYCAKVRWRLIPRVF